MTEDRLAHKGDVADKPGSHIWSSEDYSGGAATEARHSRQQQAWAGRPFATDDDDVGSRNSSRPASENGGGYQPHYHVAHALPSGKVGSTSFDAEAYSGARAASAAAKQQRFDSAASASAPFAVSTGAGGMEGLPSGEAYHYHKQQQSEPAAKVGAAGHQYTKPQYVEPAGKVGANASNPHLLPRKQPDNAPEAAGKVGAGAAWDQQAVEEACRRRNAEQAASRKKNWGTPGLLG